MAPPLEIAELFAVMVAVARGMMQLFPLKVPWHTFTVTVSVGVLSPFALVQYREKLCGADPVRAPVPCDPPLPEIGAEVNKLLLLINVQLATPNASRADVFPHEIRAEPPEAIYRVLYTPSTARLGLGANEPDIICGTATAGAVVCVDC